MENKLRSASRGAAEEPMIKAVQVPQTAASPGGRQAHNTQELKRRIHDLEDEVCITYTVLQHIQCSSK